MFTMRKYSWAGARWCPVTTWGHTFASHYYNENESRVITQILLDPLFQNFTIKLKMDNILAAHLKLLCLIPSSSFVPSSFNRSWYEWIPSRFTVSFGVKSINDAQYSLQDLWRSIKIKVHCLGSNQSKTRRVLWRSIQVKVQISINECRVFFV